MDEIDECEIKINQITISLIDSNFQFHEEYCLIFYYLRNSHCAGLYCNKEIRRIKCIVFQLLTFQANWKRRSRKDLNVLAVPFNNTSSEVAKNELLSRVF